MGLRANAGSVPFLAQLGLERSVDSLPKKRGDGPQLSDRALVLVAGRLCEPTTEHGITRWLEADLV